MELQGFSGPGFSDISNSGNKRDENAENRTYLPVRIKLVTRIVKLGRKKAVLTSNEYRSLYVFNDPNMQLLNLMFMGPCIVIIFWYIMPPRCTNHRVDLTLRRLMSYIYIYIYIYIYGAPILDVSRSHTTTQHSR